MPLYEYRCETCNALTTALKAVADFQQPVPCEACGAPTRRIISRPSVHRSKSSKVERLDPRYDKLVDKAMSSTPNAEPDRHLARMKPLSGG
jgi:putative FmdB family regulatory protein